jgi:hypothetical protein
VRELLPGLHRWTAPHPEWHEDQDWDREVGCHAWEAAEALALIDPLVAEWDELDALVSRCGLPVVALVTVHWHERSSAAVRERYGAEVLSHPFGGLPAGVQAFELPSAEESALWLEPVRALVVGDVLLGAVDGALRVCPDNWLDFPKAPALLRGSLRGLLELPIEAVLVSHGEPVLHGGRSALEEALE